MNFRDKLSQRIGIIDIREIIYKIQGDNDRKQELFDLIFDSDDIIPYQATWVLTHLSLSENKWMFDKQGRLIDEVLVCQHPGKRRLLLSLIYRQPLDNPLRVDFLDFTLEKMVSNQELPAVQTLCMKLAYELCRQEPELLREFAAMLDFMDPYLLPTSIRTVRKNILKAMKTGKTLQVY